MKKYYAKPTSGEYYNWEDWYGESMAAEDNFWAGGNRDFGDINGSLRDDLKKRIENADYDMDNNWDSERTDEENATDILNSLHYYFSKSVGKEEQYLKLINEFMTCDSRDENDVLCDILQLEYDEPFITGTLRGYSQGDWMEYICPKKMESSIHYIEAVLMATGTEFAITEDMLDLDDKDEDEIEEAFDDADKFYDFTDLWRDEDVKEWVADMMHCKPEEVEILEGEY